MSNKTRRVALSAMAGSMLAFGGCLSIGDLFNPQRILAEIAFDIVGDAVLSNVPSLDLFGADADPGA